CPCDDPTTAIAKQAKEYKVAFPVFRDEKYAATDALHATITPQVFVLDSTNTVRYHGQIDNTWSARLKRNAKVSEFYLKDALDAVLAGKPVAVAKSEAVGCTIVERATAGTTDLTY